MLLFIINACVGFKVYCQARVQVPNPLFQQAPNPEPKVRPSLKNPKTQFFGLGWPNNHLIICDGGQLFISVKMKPLDWAESESLLSNSNELSKS